MKNTVFVLYWADDRNFLGIYSSQEELSKGVSIWMNKSPNKILAYEEYILNDSNVYGWDWCYVPKNVKIKDLISGGASFIPKKKYYGLNLIELQLKGLETLKEI